MALAFRVPQLPPRTTARQQTPIPLVTEKEYRPVAWKGPPTSSWTAALQELQGLEEELTGSIFDATINTNQKVARPTTTAVTTTRFDRIQLSSCTYSSLLQSIQKVENSVFHVVEKETTTIPSNTTASTTMPQTRTRTTTTSLEGGELMCRVIARSDAKLPTNIITAGGLPIQQQLVKSLDDIYHAQAHQETRLLKYMQNNNNDSQQNNQKEQQQESATTDTDDNEERDLIATIRNSLEDAGFQPLSRRDLDLCEALNAGYLLRLSILPDVSELDEIASEFFDETIDNETSVEHLFDGKAMVFWRGYSQEVTRGRLWWTKIDYVQASLVQRLFGMLRKRLDVAERGTRIFTLAVYRHATACFLHYLRIAVDRISISPKLSKSLRRAIRSPYSYSAYKLVSNDKLPNIRQVQESSSSSSSSGNGFMLSRYGGNTVKFVGSPNPMDALDPFIICEENGGHCGGGSLDCKRQRSLKVDRDMYKSLNAGDIVCPYDAKQPKPVPPMQLLERVSIGTLVDLFTREGRRNLLRTIFSKSELVEPTFEKVVVMWRPSSKSPKQQTKLRIQPPKVAYEIADMFDIQGLPAISKENNTPERNPLEIRCFEDVPMANLPAVLPKTKLVFRPADAFVFDSASLISFLLIASSFRFDSPKLDLIAFVSFSLWVIRTVFRYSNKLARYDLLVKNFLTSKITHRNSGALKYLATQAGSQRATRAALVHTWLKTLVASNGNGPLRRSQLIAIGKTELNKIIGDLREIPVDMDAALNDLEDLQLVSRMDSAGELLQVVPDDYSVSQSLKKVWNNLFDGKPSLKSLIGRRQRRQNEIPVP
jgi:hypothetical protein